MGDDLKHVRACKVTMSFWSFVLIFICRESRHTRTNICSLHPCLSVSMRSNPKAPPLPVFCHDVTLALSTFVYISGCLLRHAEHNPQQWSRAGCCPLTAPPTTPLNPPASYPAGPCVPVCVLLLLILLFSFVSMCLHICLDRSSYVGNTDDRMWRT